MSAPDGGKICLPDPRSWALLVAELRRAGEIDRAEAPGTEMPGHSAAWVALEGLYCFLLNQPAFLDDSSPLTPIANLVAAMRDLRRGCVSPMFKPQRHGGRPGNPSNFEIIKATAARAMTELMKSGMSRPEASLFVAKACGSLRGHGKVMAKTVAGWRDTMEAGEGPGAPKDGAALYAYGKPLPAELGDTPRQRADRLIEELRRFAGRLS